MSTQSWSFEERKTVEQVEESEELAPKFDQFGLVPCITRHAETLEVLMFAYMNEHTTRGKITT